jgi:tRNA pseudouridine38-40 synthase
MRKIKLTVSYDGSDYHGWQAQPGVKTIQGELKSALAKLVSGDVNVTGASRTDSGVSAIAQAVSIETNSPIPVENLPKAITGKLPKDIAVTSAEQVSEAFDVTRDVKSKLYRYTIYNGKHRPVMDIRHCWFIPSPLNTEKMSLAANDITGTKDFKSFASAADKRENTVRTVYQCNVIRKDNWVYIETEGSGFLYNMVRNIVGTLVEIGKGQREPYCIGEIIKAENRRAAGMLAPAKGLCLSWIKY